jgi:chemotaxis protein histidine kinase CheA
MADSVIKYSDLIGEDDTFDVIFDNIDKLRKELSDLAKDAQAGLELVNPNDEKALKEAVKQVEKLAAAKKKLDTEEKKAVKTKKKLADLTDEELIQREKLKVANRERVQRAKQMAILTSREAGEIEKLRAKLSLTTMQWKKLSKEELQNTKHGKNLIKTKLKLTNQLKKLEKQTGDTRRNVGNYTQSLGKLGKVAARLFIGRTMVDGLRKVGGAFVDIFKANKEGNKDFERFENTILAVRDKLKEIGLAIINFIVPIVQRVVRMFQFFGEKISAAAGEGTALGAVFDGIKWAVTGVIDVLMDMPAILAGISALFEAWGAHIKAIFANMSLDVQRLTLVMQEAFLRATGVDTSVMQKQIKDLDKQISDNLKNLIVNGDQVKKIYTEAAQKARDEFAEFEKEQDEIERKAAEAAKRREGSLERQNKLLQIQIKLQQNLNLRVDAIVSLQNKIEKAEASNIKDRTERLIRLEEIKAKAINEQREKDFSAYVALLETQEETLIDLWGENSAEVIAFRTETGQELLDLEAKNQKLSEEQLEASENRKNKIIEDSHKKRIDEVTKTVKKAQSLTEKQAKEEAKMLENAAKSTSEAVKANERDMAEQQKKATDAAKKRKDATQELLNGIRDTTQKIGAAIVSTFEKQADAAGDLVESQAEAVEAQRKRAEDGLSNTLKFEQEQLAQREAERIRAEKKAKQAAEFVALINLVSAYAASGDSNALSRGLVDWSLLKALEAGFEEGGYTGDKGTSDVAGVVHGREFVVTADDVKRFGLAGKSGSDFGEAMSDYFYSPLQQNLYNGQANNFAKGMSGRPNDFARLEDEMRAMRRAFQSVPKNDFDILQMTDYFVDIAKRVTSNRMTNVSKQRKRL